MIPRMQIASGTYQDVWYTFNAGSNTSVTINFDPGTMSSWALVVSLGCGRRGVLRGGSVGTGRDRR